MPFGQNGEHVTVRLIDFDDLEQNQYVVTTQFTFRAGATEKRADLVLLVNGIPLVVIEAKTPVRSSQSWLDGALQVHDDYEQQRPGAVRAERLLGRHRGQGAPLRLDRDAGRALGAVARRGRRRLPALAAGRPSGRTRCCGRTCVLDLLANFTAYATDKKKRRIKIVARYQQYEGANKIVERVVAGHPKKGLIWHFQGSGKSLLMLFAARKLRLHPALRNPTVMIVVDRIDLDAQISGT